MAVVLTVVFRDGAKYVPIKILSSENTSNIGKPDILLTANKEPIRLSVTVNNSPLEPSILNIGFVDPEPINVSIVSVLAERRAEVPVNPCTFVSPLTVNPVTLLIVVLKSGSPLFLSSVKVFVLLYVNPVANVFVVAPEIVLKSTV